jgi:hypothetical protein
MSLGEHFVTGTPLYDSVKGQWDTVLSWTENQLGTGVVWSGVKGAYTQHLSYDTFPQLIGQDVRVICTPLRTHQPTSGMDAIAIGVQAVFDKNNGRVTYLNPAADPESSAFAYDTLVVILMSRDTLANTVAQTGDVFRITGDTGVTVIDDTMRTMGIWSVTSYDAKDTYHYLPTDKRHVVRSSSTTDGNWFNYDFSGKGDKLGNMPGGDSQKRFNDYITFGIEPVPLEDAPVISVYCTTAWALAAVRINDARTHVIGVSLFFPDSQPTSRMVIAVSSLVSRTDDSTNSLSFWRWKEQHPNASDVDCLKRDHYHGHPYPRVLVKNSSAQTVFDSTRVYSGSYQYPMYATTFQSYSTVGSPTFTRQWGIVRFSGIDHKVRAKVTRGERAASHLVRPFIVAGSFSSIVAVTQSEKYRTTTNSDCFLGYCSPTGIKITDTHYGGAVLTCMTAMSKWDSTSLDQASFHLRAYYGESYWERVTVFDMWKVIKGAFKDLLAFSPSVGSGMAAAFIPLIFGTSSIGAARTRDIDSNGRPLPMYHYLNLPSLGSLRLDGSSTISYTTNTPFTVAPTVKRSGELTSESDTPAEPYVHPTPPEDTTGPALEPPAVLPEEEAPINVSEPDGIGTPRSLLPNNGRPDLANLAASIRGVYKTEGVYYSGQADIMEAYLAFYEINNGTAPGYAPDSTPSHKIYDIYGVLNESCDAYILSQFLGFLPNYLCWKHDLDTAGISDLMFTAAFYDHARFDGVLFYPGTRYHKLSYARVQFDPVLASLLGNDDDGVVYRDIRGSTQSFADKLSIIYLDEEEDGTLMARPLARYLGAPLEFNTTGALYGTFDDCWPYCFVAFDVWDYPQLPNVVVVAEDEPFPSTKAFSTGDILLQRFLRRRHYVRYDGRVAEEVEATQSQIDNRISIYELDQTKMYDFSSVFSNPSAGYDSLRDREATVYFESVHAFSTMIYEEYSQTFNGITGSSPMMMCADPATDYTTGHVGELYRKFIGSFFKGWDFFPGYYDPETLRFDPPEGWGFKYGVPEKFVGEQVMETFSGNTFDWLEEKVHRVGMLMQSVAGNYSYPQMNVHFGRYRTPNTPEGTPHRIIATMRKFSQRNSTFAGAGYVPATKFEF